MVFFELVVFFITTMSQNVFDIDGEELTSQGNIFGTKAHGFFTKNPKKDVLRQGLHKGRSGLGNDILMYPIDNAKRRGRHAVSKSARRQNDKWVFANMT